MRRLLRLVDLISKTAIFTSVSVFGLLLRLKPRLFFSSLLSLSLSLSLFPSLSVCLSVPFLPLFYFLHSGELKIPSRFSLITLSYFRPFPSKLVILDEYCSLRLSHISPSISWNISHFFLSIFCPLACLIFLHSRFQFLFFLRFRDSLAFLVLSLRGGTAGSEWSSYTPWSTFSSV